MPEKGRQLYELQSGAEARALLDKGLAAGSVQSLTEVARRYFHTKAGYEATMLLGRWQLDQGRPLAAALTLKRVADTPAAAAAYDPELAVLLATCWSHARMPDRARETLLALKQRMPNAKVQLGAEQTSLFSSDSEALAWLEKIVGAGGAAKAQEATQWVMFRGNEMRNATTSGSLPLLNYRWDFPTVNDPQDEARVKALTKTQLDRAEPVIPSVQPLAVGDTLLVRTPERLLGVDQKSGKRLWVFPWDDSSYERATRNNSQVVRSSLADQRDSELKQRLWEDNCFGQMSSDGEQVFLIDDLGYAPVSNYSSNARVFVGPNGRLMRNDNMARPYNKLVALDLKKQGKLRWIVGGDGGEDDANLAGAFFLGAPLPLEGQLFVLAEFNGEIRLCCLNAATGMLEWKQQVALMEDNQQIMFDSVRRLAGASPSYADGVLVCPTSGGAVVAIDRTTRSLLWGYQYNRWDAAQRIPGAFGFQSYRNKGAPTDHWLDSSATIADGCVLLTPVESQELHCLDLLTGKARWTAPTATLPRANLLYVACIHDHRAILVGKDEVRAIALADGQTAWSLALDQPGDLPSGRGYYSGRFYFLPTVGKELLKIDLETGKIAIRAKTEIPLGNLVCYRDELISQSSEFVASFYLSDPLRARIDETLKKNPNDIWALTRRGEILLQEGSPQRALDALWKAHDLEPANDATRNMLVKVVLLLLKDDYAAHREMAAKIEKLIDRPQQRRELLRLQAQGLEQEGEAWKAFQAYIALSQTPPDSALPPEELERVEQERRVRADRWVQGRLQSLYLAADDPLRVQMNEQIQTRVDQTLAADEIASLRAFNAHFGFHPLAAQVRLALAAKLVAADQPLEAELLAGQLLESSEAAIAGGATAVLAQLYEKNRRNDLAVQYYRDLEKRYADVLCPGGETGRALAARALQSDVLQHEIALETWPTGRTVEQTEKPNSEANEANNPQRQRITYPLPLVEFSGAAPRGMRAGYDPSNVAVTMRDSFDRLLVAASLRNTESPNRRQFSMPYNSLSAKANGHLLVVNLGSEIVAVNGLRAVGPSSEPLLWRQEMVDIDPNSRTGIFPQQRAVSSPLVGPRQIYYDPTGRLNFTNGPLTATGICYQKARQVICADPLTGETIWQRGGIEPTSEIFGDDEMLFVVGPNSDEALVLSAIDGRTLGKRKVPRADRRWATNGRRVLSWEQKGSSLTVRLADMGTEPEGAELWKVEVPLGTKGYLIEGEEVALLKTDGQLSIVSLHDGQSRLAAQLEPEPSLTWLQVQRSRERYIILTCGQQIGGSEIMAQPITNMTSTHSLMNGRAYAFDRHTGKSQWPVPAYISQHGFPSDQPAESPLLLFVRNLNTQKTNNNSWRASVLAIDKRDGRIVVENDDLNNTSSNRAGMVNNCEITANAEEKTVTLTVYSPQVRSLTLQLTNNPQPPAPPAQTGVLSSLTAGKPSGTVDGIIGAVIRAFAP
jgi:outer membrane protein assembly factor BamB